MTIDRHQLAEQVLEAQRQVFVAMHSAAWPTWLQLDITMVQTKALFTLASDGPMAISQVATALGIGRPAASILVDRLVELGFVERAEDPVDRRRTYARLTPRAEELLAQLRQDGRERLQECIDQLSDVDLAALVQGLGALSAAINRPRLVAQG